MANDPQKPSLLDLLNGVAGGDPLAGTGQQQPVPTPLTPALAPSGEDYAQSVALNGRPTLGPEPLDWPAGKTDNAPVAGGTNQGDTITLPPQDSANSVNPSLSAPTGKTPEEKNAHPGFLEKLKQFASGASGESGLSGPNSTPASKGAAISSLIGRLGNGLALAAGTPEQKQIAAEMSQQPLKTAQTLSLMGYRQRQGDIGQQNADTKGQVADTGAMKAANSMRLKGYVPDEKTPGAFRPMSEDEILSDPLLSQNRDLADAAIASKKSGAALSEARRDALMNPNNPTLLLKAQQIENQYKLAQASLGMRLHTQARQDQEFQYNFGQAPGGPTAPQNPTAPGAGGAGRAQAQPGGLSLDNAPDMMLVNPATGLPIPMKMLSALKPTMDEQHRAQFAASAIHSADKIQQLVDQAKAQIGPFAGRTAELMAKAGLGDQFNQELQNYTRFVQSAATAAHTGRFSVPILEKMDKMIGPEMNPDQLTGAIDSIKGQMAPYADSGWKPTVWEYRAWLSGAGTTPSGKTAPKAPSTGGPKEGDTATGPGNHKIIFSGGKWIDAATKSPIR